MIKSSVGRGGRNLPNDVRIVQQMLNMVEVPSAHTLVVDGNMGVRTIDKIQTFQRTARLLQVNGLVEPESKTMAALMEHSETQDTVQNQQELTKPDKSNTEMGAPWIDVAKGEIGQKEVDGPKSNPRIMEYHKTAGFWVKDDTGRENAWCASFAAWVMAKQGIALPHNAFRVSEWKTFGTKLKEPVYGALCIKPRTGGNHIAFIVGKSRDNKYYYMLGGNQDDEVNISRYPKKGWTDFRFPPNATPGDTLPVYTGEASGAGSEA